MKVTLGFQIDQCGPGSFQAQPDYFKLKTIIDSLQQFSSKYNTHVIVKPSYPKWEQTLGLLDTIKYLGGSYALDIFSSDNIAMRVDTWHAPHDIQHGISKSIQNIISLKDRHPDHFVAFWFHELLCMDWMIRSGRTGQTKYWEGFSDLAPVVGNFYEATYVNPFLSYAQGKKMPVYWSEPKWDSQLDPAPVISAFANFYKNTIIPVYANNINTDGQVNTYKAKLQSIFKYSNNLWGLSNQSWRWDGTGHICPVDQYLQWTMDAVNSGASVLRFEPGGLLWNIPIVFEPVLPSHDARPSYIFQAVSGALLS
jgi:hypothetical protein